MICCYKGDALIFIMSDKFYAVFGLLYLFSLFIGFFIFGGPFLPTQYGVLDLRLFILSGC
jgi:hypothetical protein